jgi:hypothetical protein
MSRTPDYVAKKFTPQLRRTVEAALAEQIAREFPRIGGARMVALCVTLLLEVVDAHHYRQETVSHGQIRWTAVAADAPPGHRQQLTSAHLRPVVLDLVTPADIEAILARETAYERLLRQSVRLCHQAYTQGAVLSNCDLALLLHVAESRIAEVLATYERQTQQAVPRRGTLHDVGTAVTHKRIICLKRYREGKESNTIARETYHSLEAVDRYLQQFARVRLCRQQGFTPEQIAVTLQCSQRLVAEYQAIDDELCGIMPAEEMTITSSA